MGRRGTDAGRRSASPWEAALWDQVTEVVAACGCTVHCQMASFMSRARVPQGVTFQWLSLLFCPQPPGRAYARMRWGAARPENQRLILAAWTTLAPRGAKSVNLPRPRPHERERLRLVRLSEARQTLLPDGAHPPQRSAHLPPATAAAPHAHTRTHTGTQTHMNAHARTPRCRHTGTHVHTCAHGDVAAPRPACCSSSWVEGTPPAYPTRPGDLNSSPSTRRASAPVPTASRAHPPRVTCRLGTQGESSQTSTELEDGGGRWGPAARTGSPGGDLPPPPLQGYPSPVSLPPRKLAGCEPTQCQPQPTSVCSSPAAG